MGNSIFSSIFLKNNNNNNIIYLILTILSKIYMKL